MKKINRLINTLRYLQLKQIIWKFWYRYRIPPKIATSVNQPIHLPSQAWQFKLERQRCIDNQQFCFMGISADVLAPQTWKNPDYPRLWRYHINYFHDLNQQNLSVETEFWQEVLSKWTQAHPVMTADSWDPYPLSLRIVNWIIWHLRHHALTQPLIDNLHTQCKALSKQIEWHIDANHLWANAKALVFAGCLFSEQNSWYEQGMRLISRELKRQWSTDGGHIELSPMYHALLTNDLLELIALHQYYAKPYPQNWKQLCKKMLNWAATVTHPDGNYAFFNDCTLGVAPTYSALCRAAKQLQIIPDSILNNASGYARYDSKKYTLIADTADIGCSFQPGHAHADNLSFELSIGKQRILVNSGISTYENNSERHWQRSTAAHNTLTIDGKNSSQIWHAFRVAKRATVIKRHFTKRIIAASHNGYLRLHDPILHSRQWRVSEDCLTVTDHIHGKMRHHIDLHCHFHPVCQLKTNDHTLLVHYQDTHIASLIFPEGSEIQIVDGFWYPAFGKAEKNQRIQIHFAKQPLPFTIHWDIIIHGENV